MLRLEAYDGNGVKLQYNEYDFDALGNLLQRHDQSGSKDLKEAFSYDALNRLSTVELTAPGFGLSSVQTLSLSYNEAGNITHKSDVGTYSYGAGNAGPHAVTSAGGQTYTYDANGNMISGDGRSISYTIFDKASQISQGGNTVDFYYDMNRNRYQRVEGSKTTTYVGNVEIIDTPTELEYRRSIAGVAIQHLFPNSQTYREEYLLKDHLGSIDIITDESGEVITDGFLNPIGELSFDAFGQRRQASDWRLTIQGSNPVPQSTTRGYTGHEMVDSVNVIHMNGRIYDPKLGRFMQADPHVQAPENAQNLNRYSYVLNNPLSYTDPSGFIFKKLVRGLFKIAPFGLLGYLATKNPLLNAIAQTVACIAGGPVGCGAYAAYSTYLNTGSLGQALKSGLIAGVTAYAFQQIGGADLGGTERVLAHGFVGGVSAELQGGKFGHGFASAGLTKIFTVKTGNWLSKQHTLTGATIAAAVGGTISQATGGKFANGAATAAMGYVYNQRRTQNRAKSFNDAVEKSIDSGRRIRSSLRTLRNQLPDNINYADAFLGKPIGAPIYIEDAGFWDKLLGREPYFTFSSGVDFHGADGWNLANGLGVEGHAPFGGSNQDISAIGALVINLPDNMAFSRSAGETASRNFNGIPVYIDAPGSNGVFRVQSNLEGISSCTVISGSASGC